jgi:hypothetical protein
LEDLRRKAVLCETPQTSPPCGKGFISQHTTIFKDALSMRFFKKKQLKNRMDTASITLNIQ